MVVVTHPVDRSEHPAVDVQTDDALGALLDAHRQSAFNLAYRLTRRPEDAADAVQDAFVLAVRATRSDTAALRDAGRFRPWLLKIVANVALGQLRRKRSDTTASLDELTLEPADPRSEQPLAALMRRERRGDVLNALLILPDDQRIALTLREYQDLSYDEIGDLLGLNRAATTALLYRARCAFRRAYQGLLARSAPIGCPELVPLISAMLDEELDASTWRDVEQHVSGCRRCRFELRQLRSARRLHATIPLLAPPAGWSWASTLEAARTVGGLGAASLAANDVRLVPAITTGASAGAANVLPGAAMVGLMTSLGGLVNGRMTGLALIVGLNLGVMVGAPTHQVAGPHAVQAAVAAPVAVADAAVSDVAVSDGPAASTVMTETARPAGGAQTAAASVDPAEAIAPASASAPALAPADAVGQAGPAATALEDGRAVDAVTSGPPEGGATTPAQSLSPPAEAAGGGSGQGPRSAAPGPGATGAGQGAAPAPIGQVTGAVGQVTNVVGAVEDAVAGLTEEEAPSLNLPPADVPPIDVPPINLPTVDLPPINLPAVDLPPIQVPPVDLPPIDAPPVTLPVAGAPPVDLPPVDVPAVQAPAVDLPPVDLPPVDPPAVALPAVDLPPVNVPPVNLPPVNPASIQFPAASVPASTIPVDQVKSATAPARTEPAPEQQTFSNGGAPVPPGQPERLQVDAGLPSGAGDESKSGGSPVEVTAGAANATGPDGSTRVDVDVNAANSLSNGSGAATLVDASTGASSPASSGGNTLTVHTGTGAGNSTATSVSASVENGAGTGLVESVSAGSLTVSVDNNASGSGNSDSSSNDGGSVSVSVSFDSSSSNGGGGDGGNSSGGGDAGGGGVSVSVGGISVSLP